MVSLDKMNTRDRIIRASLELFTKKGYVATTTKEIAELASISEVTLFRHFRSKEIIFRSMVDKYLPKLTDKLMNVEVPNKDDVAEVLAEVAKGLFTVLNNESKMIKLTIQMPEIYPVKNDDLYDVGVISKEKFKSILIEQYELGRLEEKNWDVSARALAALVFGFFLMESYYSNLYSENTTEMLGQIVKEHVNGW